MERLVEVQAVRECIARVNRTREAHALVVGQRDVAVRELNELIAEQTAVQSRLTAREKEIALAGGELPDEPFPEDAEMFRLRRGVRIRQERVCIHEAKVQESQARIDARIRELEETWEALGAEISNKLLTRFREAASALRDAQLEYFSLYRHFCSKWNTACWKHETSKLTIGDPMTAELILNPIHIGIAARWPLSAQALLKSVEELRAEIDAVK